jgi:hypothetical protein
MKSQWGILVFEEEKFTTVSITGTLVHSHPVTDQLKWSHYEEYFFLQNRSSPLSPLYRNFQLWYTFTLLRISWNEVTMRNTWFWRRDPHHCLHYRSFGTLSPCYGSAEMKLRWRLLVFEEEIYISGASVHFHHILDQLKWSYNEH